MAMVCEFYPIWKCYGEDGVSRNGQDADIPFSSPQSSSKPPTAAEASTSSNSCAPNAPIGNVSAISPHKIPKKKFFLTLPPPRRLQSRRPNPHQPRQRRDRNPRLTHPPRPPRNRRRALGDRHLRYAPARNGLAGRDETGSPALPRHSGGSGERQTRSSMLSSRRGALGTRRCGAAAHACSGRRAGGCEGG